MKKWWKAYLHEGAAVLFGVPYGCWAGAATELCGTVVSRAATIFEEQTHAFRIAAFADRQTND